jgi:hypothetical protein
MRLIATAELHELSGFEQAIPKMDALSADFQGLAENATHSA